MFFYLTLFIYINYSIFKSIKIINFIIIIKLILIEYNFEIIKYYKMYTRLHVYT